MSVIHTLTEEFREARRGYEKASPTNIRYNRAMRLAFFKLADAIKHARKQHLVVPVEAMRAVEAEVFLTYGPRVNTTSHRITIDTSNGNMILTSLSKGTTRLIRDFDDFLAIVGNWEG